LTSPDRILDTHWHGAARVPSARIDENSSDLTDGATPEMTDDQRANSGPANRARSDGLASIAIMLLAIALIAFVIIKVV
jgi:hypothetical protein